jgi:hypothetical protein
MRRFLSAFGFLVLAAGPALAGHVFFFHVFGAWAVTCDRDLTSGRKSCAMSAPPPALGGPRPMISVTEPAPGAHAVAVRVPGHVDTARPFLLAVDGKPGDPATPSPFGEAAWTGPGGAALMAMLAAGRQVTLYYGLISGEARAETFSLSGFAEARDSLGRNLRAHGILK